MKQMHSICFTILCFFIFIRAGLSRDQTQTVYSIRIVQHDNAWYLNQMNLWEKEIKKNPKNADAWYNYYKAIRYANFNEAQFQEDKLKKFNEILSNMEKYVPQSFEFALMSYIITQCDQGGSGNDYSWLEEAFRRNPKRTETYDSFMDRYEVREPDINNLAKFSKLWYESGEIPSFLLEYNYNVLVSADENGIIFTHGDNDTYPLWILQQVKGIRRDVTVLNIYQIRGYPEYLLRKLNEKGIALKRQQLPNGQIDTYLADISDIIYKQNPDIKIYYALTMHHRYIDFLKDKLFLTGLVNQYSPRGIDNFALLKRNILSRYRLDYLSNDWNNENNISAPLIDYMNANYVMPFMKLAEHLYLSGDEQEAVYLKKVALNLAQKVNINELITFIKSKNFQ